MRLRIDQSSHASRWLWGAGFGLVLTVVVVVCVFLDTQNRTLSTPVAKEISKPNADIPSAQPTAKLLGTAVETQPQLPHLDFPPGSVEEACGLNGLPTYSIRVSYGTIIAKTLDRTKALESDACQTALEAHMSAMNPQQYLSGAPESASLAELVVLDEPFTFERIFADPDGDLTRVQDALSRPECLLEGDESNWELKETCHAEALLNYAFVNLFCFGGGIKSRIRPVERSVSYFNPTLEQDRILWKQDLEDSWMTAKCAALDPTLELSGEHYPLLHAIVISLDDTKRTPFSKGSDALLVELAARLGDDVAGLSQIVISGDGAWRFQGAGYKFGRISNLVEMGEWSRFAVKKVPSTDRFLKAFYLLAKLDSPKSDPQYEIEFDWEFVARHLCEPPYFYHTLSSVQPVENREHSSCKEIVHEIRQKGITFPPLVKVLNKFEQVAIEVGVYE